MDEMIHLGPIGVIHTPFKDIKGMPIQPAGARDVIGTVEIDAEFEDGLADLDGFSHVILLYHFHKSAGYALTVTPFLDKNPRGLFSTRAPRRPNPIGLSVVSLLEVDGTILTVQGIDVVDGTPLLDIKPYVPKFDAPQVERTGWLEQSAARVQGMRADDRFR